MTTTTLTKNARVMVAAGTSNAAGAITRGVQLDLRTAQGGVLTMKIINGTTGPTAPCEGRVLIAHTNGATPNPANAGADWKSVWGFNGGLVASAVTERMFPVDVGVMHLEVEFAGNTGQGATVEAYFSEVTDAQSV